MKPLGPMSDTYPDPHVVVLDERFGRYLIRHSGVERIAAGTTLGEGPVWFADHRALIWSDIPGDRILRWDEQSGETSVFRQPSNFANGNARDLQGRLVTCEHGGRRVVRTEYDGSLTVLAETFDGKRLNSPNDLAVAPDGAIWFTDPVFGISGDFEGHPAESEITPGVYRVDPDDGEVSLITAEYGNPNGIAFSPDGTRVYLVEALGDPHKSIQVHELDADQRGIGPRRRIIDGVDGFPDGFAIDVDGNLWCGWNGFTTEAHGVRVFDAEGAPLGRIDLPEPCANVTFGGRGRSRLFMAASMSLYALYVRTHGA